jgi:hypothetical protein
MNATDTNDVGHDVDRDQVIHVFGPIDDGAILRILATGASEAELLEARERLERPGEVAEETRHSLAGVVAEIVEIVQSAEPEPDESHDRD